MIILALNCGSSSLKYQLFDNDKNKRLVKGQIERIGEVDSVICNKLFDGIEVRGIQSVADHSQALQFVMDFVTSPENNLINDISEISAVGHRVVHGGDMFARSVIIDNDVLNAIKGVAHLAPLHNPPNILGIESAMRVLSGVPQIAVFDTAFHQTMPDYAYMYSVPYEWYEKHKVRRYGFHGSSHLYVSKRASVLLGKKPVDTTVITMHIGNGVSHTAVRNGISVDTSMGFTPLEGAMMGTRSGSIDPAIISYIMEKENVSESDVETILNKKSGLLGITGKFSDRRDVEEKANGGDYRCKLALMMEGYRLKKYIGSYAAVLGGADALVFTAGVGENNPLIREIACTGLEFMGIHFDNDKNWQVRGGKSEEVISKPDSPVKVYVIPTNEEIVMIEDILALLNGTYTDHIHMDYSFQK